MAPHGLRFGGVALTRGDLQLSGDGFGHPDPMARDRLPVKSQDLARFGQKRDQDLGEMWPGGLPYGSPGAGMQLGGSVSAVGCDSGPCWAIWGHVGVGSGPFSIFPGIPGFPGLCFLFSYYSPVWLAYYSLLFPGVAGLFIPQGTPHTRAR